MSRGEDERDKNVDDAQTSKRRRTELDADNAGAQERIVASGEAQPAPDPSQLATSLKNLSPDALKASLEAIRKATHVPSTAQDHLAADDHRLLFARDFLTEHKGRDRLFEAWERIHDLQISSLRPLPLLVISNLVGLTSYHYIDNALAMSLVQPIVPTYSLSRDSDAAPFWTRLHSYFITCQLGANRRGDHKGTNSDEAILSASVKLLKNVVRFDGGRFARAIVENFPWNAKAIDKISSSRKKASKSKSTGLQRSLATFTRPDLRLSLLSLILAILHPAPLPAERSSAIAHVNSGASTSTKILLLSKEYGMATVSSMVNSLRTDHLDVAFEVLRVLERSIFHDTKFPRGTLITLVKSTNLLDSMLHLAGQSSQHEAAIMSILSDLCTKPGRGLCFEDRGWYGRSPQTEDISPEWRADDLLDIAESGETTGPPSSIYNPILSYFIQSSAFSPLYNSFHRQLLLSIMVATPELQPAYMSSPRSAFSGGRLEPPVGGPTAGSGARLSGLLANRLLGQMLDLSLPALDLELPPPLPRLVSAVIPQVIARANLMKGLRHEDRLVRWSTLDVLIRLFGRIDRVLLFSTRSTHPDQAWHKAATYLLKEMGKKVPDLATVMSCVERVPAMSGSGQNGKGTEQTVADGQQTSPDWLLIEATLKASLRYLRVFRRFKGATAWHQQNLYVDIRKLLSADYLTLSPDTYEASFLQPLIQLHTIRIARVLKPRLFGVGSNSAFAQIVDFSMSPQVTAETRREAQKLLIEAFADDFGEDRSRESTASLIFEGDKGEFEAWLSALPSGASEQAKRARSRVVHLIEECLSRCLKNTYRYLELARCMSQEFQSSDADHSAAATNGLPVSPLFATLLEQLCIKISKRIFSDVETEVAVLQFTRCLFPLLLSRNRPGASQALQGSQSNLLETMRTADLPSEQLTIISGLDCLMPWATLSKHSGTSTQRVNLNETDAGFRIGEPLTYTSLLLCQPSTLQPSSVYPNTVRLLQIYNLLREGDLKAALKFDDQLMSTELMPEPPALAKFGDFLAAAILGASAGKSKPPTKFASKVLKATLASNKSMGHSAFLKFPGFENVVNDAKVFDDFSNIVASSIKPSDSACQPRLMDLLSRAIEQLGICPAVLRFVPYANDATLALLWTTIIQKLDETNAAGAVVMLQALREILIMRSCAAPVSNEESALRTVMQTANRFADDEDVIFDAISLGLALLISFARGPQGPSSDSTERRKFLGSVDLRWLYSGVPGGDGFLAALVSRFEDVAAAFGQSLRGGSQELQQKAEELPLSLRAWLRSRNVADNIDASLHGALANTLSALAFRPQSNLSKLAGESLYLLYEMQIPTSSTADNDAADRMDHLVRAFEARIPERPQDAFRVGAVHFLSELVVRCDDVPPPAAVARVAQNMLDLTLSWLVRRFAEDDEDSEELLVTLNTAATLLYRSVRRGVAISKPFLAEPVIEAGLKRRLEGEKQSSFLQILVACTELGSPAVTGLLATLLSHPQLRIVAQTTDDEDGQAIESQRSDPAARQRLVSTIHSLACKHPMQSLTPQNLSVMASIYGASLSQSDRLLFDLFQQSEEYHGRGHFISAIRMWSDRGTSQQDQSSRPLNTLLSLDSAKVLKTCTNFPRERTFDHIAPSGCNREDSCSPESRGAYDPLWIISILATTLQEQHQISGLQWLAIVRTNALGVAMCCLSSKAEKVRSMGLTSLARVYTGIEAADVQEKQHLLLGLDCVRNSVTRQKDGTLMPLPLTTTLFLAHHLRLVGSPSSTLYPIFTRFLLQRPTFDTSDVPMLYSLLQSTDPEHWKMSRLWILRFLRDVTAAGGASLEWRVLKRRYVWELLTSMYTGASRSLSVTHLFEGAAIPGKRGSSGTVGANALSSLRQTLLLIQETMLAAAKIPRIAMELLTRKALLSWILQQMALERAQVAGGGIATASLVPASSGEEEVRSERRIGTPFWLNLLKTVLFAVDDFARLNKATDGTWTSGVLSILEGVQKSEAQAAGGNWGHRASNVVLNVVDTLADVISVIVEKTPSPHNVVEPSRPMITPSCVARIQPLLGWAIDTLETATLREIEDEPSKAGASMQVLAARIMDLLASVAVLGAPSEGGVGEIRYVQEERDLIFNRAIRLTSQ